MQHGKALAEVVVHAYKPKTLGINAEGLQDETTLGYIVLETVSKRRKEKSKKRRDVGGGKGEKEG